MFVLDEADVMIDQQGQQDQTVRIQKWVLCRDNCCQIETGSCLQGVDWLEYRLAAMLSYYKGSTNHIPSSPERVLLRAQVYNILWTRANHKWLATGDLKPQFLIQYWQNLSPLRHNLVFYTTCTCSFEEFLVHEFDAGNSITMSSWFVLMHADSYQKHVRRSSSQLHIVMK